MTGLLVSVRNGAEAIAALRGGAALIDVKEPRHGALGRAAAERWQEVVAQVNGRVPVSVACGELLADAPVPSPADLASIRYIKCGLAGCGTVPDWPRRWAQWLGQLPHTVGPVAVAYADWQRAAAPPPEEILPWAVHLRCRALLWDTYTKDGTSLRDHAAPPALQALTHAAHQHGLLVVLAGSLARHHVPALLALHPDFLAVRGAACGGDRQAAVQQHLVAQLARSLTTRAQSAGRGAAVRADTAAQTRV